MKRMLVAGAVVAAIVFQGSPLHVGADGELAVAVLGAPDTSDYPTVQVHVSAVDRASGRPATVLDKNSFIFQDDSGVLEVTRVEPAVASEWEAKTAYILAIDTGSNVKSDPAKLQRAQDFALGVIQNLGSNDVVRLVLFNSGVDDSPTGWVARSDPTLAARLQQLAATDVVTDLDLALRRTAELSRSAPAGFDRRAVILVAPVDDESLIPDVDDTEIVGLNVRFFAFSLGQASLNARMPVFYESLATLSGGGHWSLEDLTGLEAATRRAFELSQRTWRVTLTADGLPDGALHTATAAVTDVAGTGSTSFSYSAGPLSSVTQAVFANIADNDRVSSDREIQVSLQGKAWPTYRIELFQDCSPGDRCAPVATSENRALEHRLAVGGLGQGEHTLLARVTVSDAAGRQFSDASARLDFERKGTTFNLPVLFLVAGIASIAIAIVAVASLRRNAVRGVSPPMDATRT